MDQEQFWDDYQHLKREASLLRDSERRLKEIRGRYHTLMESAPILIAYLDREGRILEMSQGGLALIERPENEVVGRLTVEVFADEGGRTLGPAASNAISKGELVDFKWSVRRIHGPSLTLNAQAAPVRDETGTVVAACVTAMVEPA